MWPLSHQWKMTRLLGEVDLLAALNKPNKCLNNHFTPQFHIILLNLVLHIKARQSQDCLVKSAPWAMTTNVA